MIIEFSGAFVVAGVVMCVVAFFVSLSSGNDDPPERN